MELRHLRYFVAVAEEGSVKLAAERRLHTAQPSLSRQIRNLEHEVGTQLLRRSARGVEMTDAGRVFLDHARLAIAQAHAAVEAARRIAQPAKPVFAIGFLVGHEGDCIPPTTSLLRNDLPGLEVRVFSGFSVDLAEDLLRGRLDVAFLRREPTSDLEFRHVLSEPLVAVLNAGHPLAARASVDPRDLAAETFIGISPVPRILREVVYGYLERVGVSVVPSFEIDNFAMAMSLVQANDGVALLPASIEVYLPPAMVSRPLSGEQPTIDLMLGFRAGNKSPILAKFLARADELAARLRHMNRSQPPN
ncbi:LysR substrate-binding domain-containing protein [Lichenifustis flavocetrariae]|uniref:LysR substrate-binding domain-containing protein n=1 Tax=Lichenifustis flavocetrariae TaxID=2949735 RepID=A0AA41YUV2_9HYPH|nr:LysR substrate-binding domain-containing protein [Lichenifustis flavocetrariae]MCW6507755.1 LysR substrate-binding domain-containing protein [Lichenifustis flavocetrariae]